jgi:spermidine synthase
MGGGGYSFPKWLVAYRPDFACMAVEIDPAIVQIAREQLFLDKLEADFDARSTGRLELPVADAWACLQDDAQGFDLIVNDAFRGNRPLGPMQTDEGARVVRSHLRAGGVYIGNVRSALEGRRARALVEAREAFERVFDHVEIIPERPEEPRKMGNNALVAWDNNVEGRNDHGRRNERHELGRMDDGARLPTVRQRGRDAAADHHRRARSHH